MSTRATYTFRDGHGETVHIYKHSDGYPTGAANAIKRALPLAWQLPRFESDEFAAAFIAGNKLPHWMEDEVCEFLTGLRTMPSRKSGDYKDKAMALKFKVPYHAFGNRNFGGGELRILERGDVRQVSPADIQYRYEIGPGNDGAIRVTGYTVDYWDDDPTKHTDEIIINCPIADFEFDALAWERTNTPYKDILLSLEQYELARAYGGQIDLVGDGKTIELPLTFEQIEARVKAWPEMRNGRSDVLDKNKAAFFKRLWAEFSHLAKRKVA